MTMPADPAGAARNECPKCGGLDGQHVLRSCVAPPAPSPDVEKLVEALLREANTPLPITGEITRQLAPILTPLQGLMREAADALADQTRRTEELAEAIRFMRDDWSPFSARACPACVYENGKFIRLCKMCEERNILARRTEEAERENRQWRTWGVIEIMLRNVNVDSFVRDKEREIEQLQQRLAAAEAKLAEIQTRKMGGAKHD